eukprot:7085809-Alexandrium_andersonii.AAC.1
MQVPAQNMNRLMRALIGNTDFKHCYDFNGFEEEVGYNVQDPTRARGWRGEGWHTSGEHGPV